MTAPLDIGLEFQDQALGHGQEDILDLKISTKQLGKKKTHVDLVNLLDDKDGFESDEEGQHDGVGDDNEENLDPDDEEDKNVAGLEAELDGLYDAYQERLKERDVKYRVKEARRKDKSREEWHGIQQQDSDGDSDESEGGYDVVQTAKAQFGDDNDSGSNSESDHDSVSFPTVRSPKRRRATDTEVGGRQNKKARTERFETSRAASMWFGQDVFAGIDLTVSDEDDDEEIYDVKGGGIDEESGGGSSQDEGPADSEDGFEVIPQEEDKDEIMWDVDHEDKDETKRSKIQSTVIKIYASPRMLTSSRIRPVNRRSGLYSPPTGQPRNYQNSPNQ